MRELPKISACLIVKNEEKNLPRCLDSIVDLVDEIIVVDTGSTDSTVEIAKSYKAKIHHSPWRNHFASHRNESFGFAKHEWILRIDADEQLFLNVSNRQFKKELADIDSEIVITRNLMQDIQNGRVAATFPQYHFFRRGEVYYKNRKHNRPVFKGPSYHLRSVVTLHYGYDRNQIGGKTQRDLHLLELMQKEEPQNHEIKFWQAQVYSHYENNYPKALDCIKTYIRNASKQKTFNQSAYVMAYEMAKAIGDDAGAMDYLRDALKKDPDSIDLHFIRMREAAAAQDGQGVEQACHAYLKAFEQNRRHPHKLDGRFFYFSGPDPLTIVLHKIATINLHRGYRYLDLFNEYIGKASEETAKAMRFVMDQDIEKILNVATKKQKAA